MVDSFEFLGLRLDNKLSFCQLTKEAIKDYQPSVKSKDSWSPPPPPPTVVPEYCTTHPALLFLQLLRRALCRKPCQTYTHNQHCCQDNGSPHIPTFRVQLLGHHSRCHYNSTGNRTPTQLPLHCTALWAQVQVPEAQEGWFWQKALYPQP